MELPYSHLNEEEIERYSMGRISEEESARFDEHLLVCESCQGRVADSDVYVSSMRGATKQVARWTQWRVAHAGVFTRLVPLFVLTGLLILLAVVGLRTASRGGASPAFAVSLAATRGAGIQAKVPAGRALTLNLDLAGLPPLQSFQLEMVDHLGKPVWRGAATSQDAIATASVPQMGDGIYFVRAYAPSGELLREYGLEVERPR